VLRENCKIGMKVTTIGCTNEPLEREDSETCKAEGRYGYSVIKEINARYIRVKSKDNEWHATFNYENIHPYWGDK
jgi:hypothetical protein